MEQCMVFHRKQNSAKENGYAQKKERFSSTFFTGHCYRSSLEDRGMVFLREGLPHLHLLRAS